MTSRRALAVLFLVGAVRPLSGAHTVVRNYTTSDGIPQAQVNALAQDGAGFLWVGTQAGGLGRYDGRRWEVFDASTGLPGSAVSALERDPEGRLVVGTSGGVVRVEGSRFRSLGSGELSVTALLAEAGGRLWIGTYRGLYLVSREGEPAQRIPVDAPLVEGPILALAPDGAGGVLVGTRVGLGRVERTAAPRMRPVPGLPAGSVGAILNRRGLPLLVSVGDAGLFSGAPGAFTRLGTDAVPGKRINWLTAETEDPEVFWIGTGDRGAFRVHAGSFEPFGTAEGIVSPIVYTILEDREGVLWFGTDAGVTKRGPSAFLTFDASDGFPPGQAIFGAAQSSDGALWFSAWDSGLLRMGADRKVRRFTSAEGLPADRVIDVAPHADGGVWVSTRKGLARIVGDRVSVPPQAALLPKGVGGLLPLPDGGLAVGTVADGLYLLAKDGTVTRAKGPFGPDIGALFRAKDGTLWAGGDGWGAVGVRADGSIVRLTRKDGLPSDQVTSGLVDAEGRLWIGTDRGAFCREPSGATRVLDRRSGFPDAYIYWIGQEPRGALWFGTNRGAVRLPKGGDLEVYTARDGLGSDECNDNGFFVDASGRIFVSTVGVSIFLGHPRPRRAVDPPVVVDEVLVAGRRDREFAGRTLPSAPGAITFRFSALSFTDETANRFRYRLVGLPDTWTETAPGQFETTYGGLAPGAYRFEVVARTADGRVSHVPAAVSFVIRPPWWRTRAALVLSVAALLGLFVGYIRVREGRLVRARETLARQVADRTEELRRANERLAALAVTDELTGLANRRRVIERLEEAIAFVRRTRTPLAVALVDLDRFKDVNDTLGHAAGDRALVNAAEAMQKELRTEDLLGRYGGEEFLAVLAGTDEAGASVVGERMRLAVETLPSDPRLGFVLTASIGLAAFDDPQLDAAELIRRADAALYTAKANGRNRVVSWGRT